MDLTPERCCGVFCKQENAFNTRQMPYNVSESPWNGANLLANR
jgi:hypothetical protein